MLPAGCLYLPDTFLLSLLRYVHLPLPLGAPPLPSCGTPVRNLLKERREKWSIQNGDPNVVNSIRSVEAGVSSSPWSGGIALPSDACSCLLRAKGCFGLLRPLLPSAIIGCVYTFFPPTSPHSSPLSRIQEKKLIDQSDEE